MIPHEAQSSSVSPFVQAHSRRLHTVPRTKQCHARVTPLSEVAAAEHRGA